MPSTDNTQLTLPEVLKRLHGEAEEQGSAAALAAEAGLSRSYVCDVLQRRREPGAKILAFLNIEKKVERVVTYREKTKRRA